MGINSKRHEEVLKRIAELQKEQAETQLQTAGKYWVPKETIDLYKNEEEAKKILIELFSKKEYCYSFSELIKILLERTGYDYSSVDKNKIIKKQNTVLKNIIDGLNNWRGELEGKINNFSQQGEIYYYAPKEKLEIYKESLEIKKPRKLGLPNHTYFYEGERNFKSSSKLLNNDPCGIYLITNILTGERYIGQAISIKERWISHIFSTDNTRLHQDMRKLGINNFAFTILKHDNPLTLDIDEVEFIKKYDTYNNGYNNTPGNIKKANLQKAYLEKIKK